jgi:carbamoyltransferase
MSRKHTYVLGINAYDHDVSACLLRDGAIAYAIAKERITREKHDRGFYEEVVNYCLTAEGISIADVDLVVRNCYIMPVDEIEQRLLNQFAPFLFNREERAQAAKNPLYLSKSPNVVTVSHHLAHAYSAFAACPFDEGVVMVVDGVGSYASDVTERHAQADMGDPLARESESYYRFKGSDIEAVTRHFATRKTRALQPRRHYSRGSEGRGRTARRKHRSRSRPGRPASSASVRDDR